MNTLITATADRSRSSRLGRWIGNEFPLLGAVVAGRVMAMLLGALWFNHLPPRSP